MIKFQEFHAKHFPDQPVPDVQATEPQGKQLKYVDDDEELGRYEDGVRRTLTDDQIAMFRHSEIQRLLAGRRRQKELDEERSKKQQYDNERLQNKQKIVDAGSRFESDAVVHHRFDVQELSYDENNKHQNSGQPQTFIWPKLGG